MLPVCGASCCIERVPGAGDWASCSAMATGKGSACHSGNRTGCGFRYAPSVGILCGSRICRAAEHIAEGFAGKAAADIHADAAAVPMRLLSWPVAMTSAQIDDFERELAGRVMLYSDAVAD